MKKYVVVFVLLCMASLASAQEIYRYMEDWYRAGEWAGQSLAELHILTMSEDTADVRIVRNMTPFPQVIDQRVKAVREGDRYVFDGWGNNAFGYFFWDNGKMLFLLDCDEFSLKEKLS